MNVILASTEQEGRAWQQFMECLPQVSHDHRWGWKSVIEKAFRWPTYYLMAMEGGEAVGILPLVQQRSRLFGNYLTSLPFLSGGGIATGTKEAENALLQGAVGLAQQLGVRHMELRYRYNPQLALPTRSNKVAVFRPVDRDPEKMLREIPHKARSDVRKSLRSGLAAEFCGEEALDDFYRLFALNMRNLGTPVYDRAFFRETLRAFPNDTFICLVRHRGEVTAASFLMGHRDTVEAGWSSSRYEYLALKPNMFLYWSILCFAGQRGYRFFDFGRSTINSGTHRFKMQWGCQEIPLYWTYWIPEGGTLPQLNPDNARYRLAIWLWKRLPVSLTTRLGPPIARCLP